MRIVTVGVCSNESGIERSSMFMTNLLHDSKVIDGMLGKEQRYGPDISIEVPLRESIKCRSPKTFAATVPPIGKTQVV
jgi:hypothetical protein